MLRRRILAAATATVLALGMSVGGAGAALANHNGGDPLPAVTGVTIDDSSAVCNGAGYEKPESPNGGTDKSAGTWEAAWGTITWDGSSISWQLNEGYDVDLCVKGSTLLAHVDTSAIPSGSYNFTAHVGHEISHVGFRVNTTPPPPSVTPSFTTSDERCDNGVLLVGGSITVDTQDGAISYEVTDADGNVVSDLSNLPPGTYTVTPTATGEATLNLDGYDSTAVIGAFDGDCDLPTLGTASVAFTYTAPTCELAQTVEVNVAGSANASLESTDTSVPGQVTFFFIADEDSVFNESEPPVFDGPGTEPTVSLVEISDDFSELTVVVQVLPANEELCDDPDLPTLALTGASGMLGTVGIVALLITLTGIGVVATRRRVEV
jgi:hypothetical protein